MAYNSVADIIGLSSFV